MSESQQQPPEQPATNPDPAPNVDPGFNPTTLPPIPPDVSIRSDQPIDVRQQEYTVE